MFRIEDIEDWQRVLLSAINVQAEPQTWRTLTVPRQPGKPLLTWHERPPESSRGF